MMFMVTYGLGTRLDWTHGSNLHRALLTTMGDLEPTTKESLGNEDLRLSGRPLRSFQAGLRKWLETNLPFIANDPAPVHGSAQYVTILGRKYHLNLWNDPDFAVSFLHSAFEIIAFANERNHPVFIFVKPELSRVAQDVAKAILALAAEDRHPLTVGAITDSLKKGGTPIIKEELDDVLKQFASLKLIHSMAMRGSGAIVPEFKLKSLFSHAG
jgi:hypothetical protein